MAIEHRGAEAGNKSYSTETRVIRALVRSVVAVLLMAVLAWPVDWMVWRLRVALGGGMGTTQVDHFTVAELKANKENYYFDGTSTVACSKSLFPEAGSGACWWVARHRQVIDRY
jgi:hypothetical protein